MAAPSTLPPLEDAYSLHVAVGAMHRADLWSDGVFLDTASAAPGGMFLAHFSQRVTVRHTAPFDMMRYGIGQNALEEMAHRDGLGRVGDLRLQLSGDSDPVLHGLTQALIPAIESQKRPSTLFVDYIVTAFFAHLVSTYGRGSASGPRRIYGLAPWQLRRVKDRMSASIDADPTLSDLANDCGLSPSQFSRAFKQATGIPPHQWLTRRRIAYARELLQASNLELSEIAQACGFCDQSHFTRIFSQSEGYTPGQWRRLRRI